MEISKTRGILETPPNNPLGYIGKFARGILENRTPKKRYTGNLDKKQQVYWKILAFVGKKRYFGMKPIKNTCIVLSYPSANLPIRTRLLGELCVTPLFKCAISK